MRKLLLLLSLCLPLMASAQGKETFKMKNGETLRGWATDSVPGKSLTITFSDGTSQSVNYEDIENVYAWSTEYDYHRRPGLDIDAAGGYIKFTDRNGGGAALAEVNVGKRFSSHCYWGVGAGALMPDGDPLIPLTTTFRYIFPLNAYRLEPFISARVGYVLNTNSDTDYLKQPDYYTFHVMPGVLVPVTKAIDVSLSAGYTHLKPTGNNILNHSVGMLTLTLGVGFHSK